MIENTSGRNPLLHLAGMAGGSGYIEEMESAGQRQLLNSDRLPTRPNEPDSAYEAAGFTFGAADPNDLLFRPATLPVGWKRRGSDHAMWSYICDEHGRDRVAIFYKAAFYDRDAFMRLVSVREHVRALLESGAEPIFDGAWLTEGGFAKALHEIGEQLSGQIESDSEYSAGWAQEAVAKARQELAKVEALKARYAGGTR